jgi:aromatic ring-opening dioxygenase catalytic subunit (LigB family)
MPVVLAAATSHAPGLTAWPEAAPLGQRESVTRALDVLKNAFLETRPDALILLTSEHWANFFLDNIGAFCVGRAEFHEGPVEPWLKVANRRIPGDPQLAGEIVSAAYASNVEPSFAYEMVLDHGTMVPIHFITDGMEVPVVPIMFNTLAPPQPSAARSARFGTIIGEVARRSSKRIAIIATGGLSHDPAERGHGRIDSKFDREFLQRISEGDLAALERYRSEDFSAAGAGAYELLAWVALSAALDGRQCNVLAYEPVVPWATGIGMVLY